MMRKVFLWTIAGVLVLGSAPVALCAEAPEYTALEAAKHIGETATVTDKVEDVHRAKGGSIFLNLGGRHPNQAFTVFISTANADAFKDVKVYQGKTISVTGKIQDHKGKPEISVKSPADITSKTDDLSGVTSEAASPAATASPTPAATP